VPEIVGAALNDAPGVELVHRLARQHAGAADGGAEQGSLAAARIFLALILGGERGLQIVMRWHPVALAAFSCGRTDQLLPLGK
jgi:hypothetical protein